MQLYSSTSGTSETAAAYWRRQRIRRRTTTRSPRRPASSRSPLFRRVVLRLRLQRPSRLSGRDASNSKGPGSTPGPFFFLTRAVGSRTCRTRASGASVFAEASADVVVLERVSHRCSGVARRRLITKARKYEEHEALLIKRLRDLRGPSRLRDRPL